MRDVLEPAATRNCPHRDQPITIAAPRKTLHHPLIGAVTLNCDVLDITDQDQQAVIYTAEPGSPAEEALRLLSVIGTQRTDVPG